MNIKNDLIVLDLETTGTWIDKDRIIEIAMVRVSPDGTQTEFHEYLNPGIAIPKVVTELTGISNEDVQDKKSFRDIAQSVLDFLDDADLGGYNVERFDLPLLAREISEAGLAFEWKNRTVYDAQKVYHLNEKRDLTAAYKFYCQKSLDDAHSAMVDTKATLAIIESQVEAYGAENKDIESLKEFDYKVHAEFYDEERKFRWWNGKLYMMFGKYARQNTLQEVVKKDPDYLRWIISAKFSEEIKLLVENALSGNYPLPPEESDDQLELFS